MGKRKQTPQTILNEESVQAVAALLRRTFTTEFPQANAFLHGVDVEGTVRFLAVAQRCKAAREQRGLSLKAVAAHLHVPQYRLRRIEEGHTREMEGDVLRRYVHYLGLASWFTRWTRTN